MTSFNTPIITRSQTSKMATIEEMAQLLSERDNKQIPIINPATFSLYFKALDNKIISINGNLNLYF